MRVSPLERRAIEARSTGEPFRDYSENVPRWPAGALKLPPSSGVELPRSYPPSAGLDLLRARIAESESRRCGLPLGCENVLVTHGALYGIGLVLRAFLSATDTVICQAPVFRAVGEQLASLVSRVEFVSLASRSGRDLSALAGSLQSHNIAAVYLDSPNNPTGDVLSVDQLEGLHSLCNSTGAILIADIVYADFLLTSEPFVHPAVGDANRWNRLFVVNSVSKAYAAPGLRIGWVLSSPSNIQMLASCLERESIAVSRFGQLYAAQLLEHGNEALIATVRRGAEVVAELAAGMPGAELRTADGGTQFLLELADLDAEWLADHLLRSHRLLVATSANCIAGGRPHLRLPLGHPPEDLAAALSTIRRALSDASVFRASPRAQRPLDAERSHG